MTESKKYRPPYHGAILAAAIPACLGFAACKADSAPRLEDEPMGSDIACESENGPDGVVSSACDYGVSINGVERGVTRSEFKLYGARGPGGSASATTTFAGAVMRPDGGVIQVLLSDDGGYELDAGSDGRLQVKPAEIDPADPEAAIDKVTAVLTSSSGLTKTYTVSCPGLFKFATNLEESGTELTPNADCPDDVAKPDAKTGCFPCKALSDLIAGHGLYVDPDVRARTVLTSKYAADLYKTHGGGERAEVVLAVVAVIATAVTNTWNTGVKCSPNYGKQSFGFNCSMSTPSNWPQI